MSGPQPPFSPETLDGIAQFGGPVNVTSGAQSSAAITFGTAFPDTNYNVALEWVSGAPPTQGYGVRAKTPSNFVLTFYGTITPSAFKWQAWRLV